MIKKYSLVFLAVLCFSWSGYGQTEIFNLAGGGVFPADWTGTNNVTGRPIDEGTYYHLQPGNPGDIIETASYNLSAYTSATFEVDIRFYGNGTPSALLVEVSTDGGATFTQSYNTPVTTDTYITRTINIPTVSANTVLRLSVNATSGRGIRLQDLILSGIGTAGPIVTYNGNGNTGGSVPTDGNNPYTSGDTVTVLGNTGSLVNTCNTFNNWNTASDGSGTAYAPAATFTITTSSTLYAQWTPTGNTVTFNANGGTGSMTPQLDCAPANLNNNTFIYAGYSFNSWNTAADGSGTSYADGATYNFSADITLYAQWDIYTGPCGGSESFDNSNALGAYGDGNYTGDNGVTWTYGHASTENSYPISGAGLMLRRASDSYLEATITGGIENFSFD